MTSPVLKSLKLLRGCKPMEIHDEEFDVTKDFSRTEAFEIGVLIDLSRQAREAGIRYPLAITPEVYQECLIGDAEEGVRDEMERALDLVTQVATIARMSPRVSRVHFDFIRDDDDFREVPLVLICSLGDFGETVLTVVRDD